MYEQLEKEINKIKRTSLLLITGDFNAKIGKRKPNSTEICYGKYSIGIRNEPGQKLIEFCNTQDFFISNSAFPHPAKHITRLITY